MDYLQLFILNKLTAVNKMHLRDLLTVIISFVKIKKLLRTLSLIPVLIMPFEQMVFSASFPLIQNKTNDVDVNSVDKNNKNGKSHKNSINQSHPDKETSNASTPPVTQLNVMADSEGGLVSNAGNFHGAWNASVDPRTGNAAFSLTVGSILYNDGRAKRDLILAYSGGPSAKGADSFGLGPHWGFNVGTEHVSAAEVEGHKTTDIATGDGHRFTMISDRNDQGNNTWRPLHHKLNDVVFSGTLPATGCSPNQRRQGNILPMAMHSGSRAVMAESCIFIMTVQVPVTIQGD